MAKIIGNTTATPNPRPDWNQEDATKADYIKNKPTVLTEDDVVELIVENAGGGSGVIVEQKYDSSSPNAQSGKAVAEAISGHNVVTFDYSNPPTTHQIMVYSGGDLYVNDGTKGVVLVKSPVKNYTSYINSINTDRPVGCQVLQEILEKINIAQIVTELPETGAPNKIYMVANSQTEESNLFDEYLWVDNRWELIGSFSANIDLSDYATKQYVEDQHFINDTSMQSYVDGKFADNPVIKVLDNNEDFTPTDNTITATKTYAGYDIKCANDTEVKTIIYAPIISSDRDKINSDDVMLRPATVEYVEDYCATQEYTSVDYVSENYYNKSYVDNCIDTAVQNHDVVIFDEPDNISSHHITAITSLGGYYDLYAQDKNAGNITLALAPVTNYEEYTENRSEDRPVACSVLSMILDNTIGDIESALNELHTYAQALISGGAE